MLIVKLLHSCGSDKVICDVAKVNFETAGWDVIEPVSERDEGLLNFLGREGHWTPFAHVHVSVGIQAPLYIARQLLRSTVGLAVNEVSRRFTISTPTYTLPKEWHVKAVTPRPRNTIRYGNGGNLDANIAEEVNEAVVEHIESAIGLYEWMIDIGVAPEQARSVLPQCIDTRWVWTGSLYAFSRVCNLRLASDTQDETRDVAIELNEILSHLYPAAWKALVVNNGGLEDGKES